MVARDDLAMPDATPPELTAEQADATMRSKAFVGLLVVVAVIGVVVSIAAWCFLEAIFQIQQELYVHLPHAVGYQNGPPKWWSLPVLAVGALIVAVAITRLPGDGGHIPAKGLVDRRPLGPGIVPGVRPGGVGDDRLRAGARPGGPADRGGRGSRWATISLPRRDTPPQARMLVLAAGSISAMSFIFSSPLIAAVIMIEATAIGGARLRLLLVPGLLAAGIGTVVSLGIGSLSGLSTHDYALGPLPLPALAHLDGRSVRVDDRVGDRDRGRDELCDAGRSAHLSIRLTPADARAPAGDRSDHRRARDRVLADHGPQRGRGSVLRPGPAPGTCQPGRNMVAGRAGVADRVQGPGVWPVTRQLPRRADVPGAVPRGCGRDHVLASRRAFRSRLPCRWGWAPRSSPCSGCRWQRWCSRRC